MGKDPYGMTRKALTILTLILFVLPAVAQQQDDTTVTLKRPQKAGTVQRYKIEAIADAGGTEVTVERKMKIEIKEVKENGDVVLVMKDEGGKIVAMGQEMEVPLASTVTVTTDKLGKVLKYERANDDLSVMAPQIERLLAVAQDYVLPEKDVKPGDTWQYEMDNPALKDTKVTVKLMYAGFEKVDETRVWKIKQAMSAPVDREGGKMEAEMTFFVNSETGVTVRAEGKFSNVPSQYGPVNITWKTSLVKPDATPAAAK